MNKNTNLDVPTRSVRHFVVYQGNDLAMLLEDKPGHLLSTAPPPPQGPAAHPFVNAQALRSSSEHQLRQILNGASDFDSFISGLLAGGFDVYSYDMQERPYRLENRRRVYSDGKLVGAICDAAGQFTTLKAQPEAGQLTSESVSVTAYEPSATQDLLKAFRAEGGFEAVSATLVKAGYLLKD